MDGIDEAYFRFLRLGCHDQKLSCRVDDFDFANNCRCIGCYKESSKVVDDQLVSPLKSSGSEGSIGKNVHTPLGPKLVRTRSDNSDTA